MKYKTLLILFSINFIFGCSVNNEIIGKNLLIPMPIYPTVCFNDDNYSSCKNEKNNNFNIFNSNL